jgi:hypothetical protein
MNQTNILVVASSVAAALTLGVVTFSQWVTPWMPLAVGVCWVVFWLVAWATLQKVGDVDVPDDPREAMPALASIVVVPLLGVLWMIPALRASVAPIALSNSSSAIEAVFEDSSADVRLAGCAAVEDVDPAQWSAIADAIADNPALAVQCSTSLSPALVDAVADRWATALKRPNLDEATACMLTEKLAVLRDGKPQVLTRDLMHCADQSKSESAKVCCEKTFDSEVEPLALLDAGTPSPSVLASFIRVQFSPGQALDEELAGRLVDATCEDPEQTQITAAYLPYVREECAAEGAGWLDAYGTDVWAEACSEELPYFRRVEERPLDEALCRGLETAAVANAVAEAKVGVGYGRSTGRSQDGVSPGVLSDVARTARARGAGTSGAGIEENREKRAPPQMWEARLGDLDVIRGDEIDYEAACRRKLSRQIGEDLSELTQETGDDLEETLGADPCDMTPEEVEALGKMIEEKDDDSDGKFQLNEEEFKRRAGSERGAEKALEMMGEEDD